MAKNSSSEVSGWVGWVYFGGIMMLLSGFFQAIAGMLALFKDEVYLIGTENLLVLDYTQWGWAHLLIGLVLIISAVSLMNGNMWGRTVGVFLASLSAIANFAYLSAYPFWALTIIVVNIFIIYAIVVHGDEAIE